MQTLRFVICVFAVAIAILGSGTASAQRYPDRSIRILAPAAGGSADLMARIVAQGLGASLGQAAVVDNRGGSPVIPASIMTKAQPDGYTLLFYSSNLWLLPFLQDSVPYDPLKDFAPISLTTVSPSLLVIHPSLPVNSVKELIALAKARPGELNFASGVTGSSTHLASVLFKSMAGIDIVRINYKGSADALNALIGGQVQIMFPIAAEAAPHIKSGRLRALAVASASPSMLAPGLPTVAASLPGYVSGTEHGLFAPANTPAAIVNLLHRETVRFLNRAEVKEKLFNLGLDLVASSPDELAASMKSDMARMGKVLKDAGIAAEQTQ